MIKNINEVDQSYKESRRQWNNVSLAEVFKEEMLGVSTEDDAEEQIVTQKSKTERLNDREVDSGKKTKDTWTSTVRSLAGNSRNISGNTMGTRVVEQRYFETDWDEEEYRDDPRSIAQDEVDYERLLSIEEPIIDDVVSTLEFNVEQGKEVSEDVAIEEADVELDDFFFENGDYSRQAETMYAAYENQVPSSVSGANWSLKVRELMAKNLGTRAWEKFNKISSSQKSQPLGESINLRRWQKLAGLLKETPEKAIKLGDGEEHCPECHGTGLRDGHGDTASPMETPAFCDTCNGKGKVLEEASTKSSLKEMGGTQLKSYVRRLAQHKWSWEEVASQLKDQYRVSPGEIRQLETDYQDELKKVKTESASKNTKTDKERHVKVDQSKNGVKVIVHKFYDDEGLRGTTVDADCKCYGSPRRTHSNRQCPLLLSSDKSLDEGLDKNDLSIIFNP